jgi:hypothetical protein
MASGIYGYPDYRDLNFFGEVTRIISATQFECATLAGKGDGFFQDWDIYVVRKGTGTGVAPQGDKAPCSAYTNLGVFTHGGFDTTALVVGDQLYLMHPFLGNNTNIVDQPSNDLKQSSVAVATTNALVLTKVKELAFTGKVGGARIQFDLKVDNVAGVASAVVCRNDVPIVTDPIAVPNYTVWTDATAIYHTFSQDISGLVVGDLVQIYAYVDNVLRTASVMNFKILYDLVHLPSVQTAIDCIYFDPDNGFPGTDIQKGTAGMPSNNEADVLTMLAERNLFKIVINSGTFTLPKNMSGIVWEGNGFMDTFGLIIVENYIDLNGHSISNSSFKGVGVEDLAGGGSLDYCGSFLYCNLWVETITFSYNFVNCAVFVISLSACSVFSNCDIYTNEGTIDGCFRFFNCTIGSGWLSTLSFCNYFINCDIAVRTIEECGEFTNCTIWCNSMTNCVTMNSCTIDENINLSMWGIGSETSYNLHGGAIDLQDLDNVGAILNFSGDFDLTVEASCLSGVINVYGNIRLINNTGGATVNDYTVLGAIGTSAMATLDGVYFDSVNGAAGTAWPIGSPANPSNSLADCKTMMAARNVDKLYLAGATGAITFDTDTDVYLVGNENYAITIAAGVTCNFTGELKCGPLTHHGAALTVYGDMKTGDVINDTLGTISVIGNAKVNGEWNNLGGDVLYIGGDFWINEAFDMDGAAAIMVDGNVTALYVVNGATGGITVGQNLFIREDLTNSNGGQVSVDGDMQVGGTWDNSGGANSTIQGNFEVGGDLVQDAVSGGLEVFGNTLLYSYTSAAAGVAISTFHGDLTISTIMTCTGIGGVTVDGKCVVSSIANSGGGDLTFNGGLKCNGGFDNTGGDDIGIIGDVFIGGTLTMSTAASTFTVYGNLRANGFTDTSTGAMVINGNMIIEGNLTINSAAGSLTVDNGLYVSGTLTTGTSVTLTIYGNTYIYDVANGTSGACFFGGDIQVATGIISNNAGTITVNGHASLNGNWNNGGGGAVVIQKDCSISGALTNTTVNFTIYGDYEGAGDISTTTGNIAVNGNFYTDGSVTSSSTGDYNIGGDFYAGNVVNDSGGVITISGNCYIAGAFSNNNAGSTFTCTGIAEIRGAITNAGTMTYRGIHPEVPINVTVTNPAETDLLDLSAASHHYTLNDFILKCADPGANTITARLYKLVNGVATLVKSSAGITTANYTSYWTLMDLFGIPSVSGDDIRIAVYVSAGGPYAVTGEYRYTDE